MRLWFFILCFFTSCSYSKLPHIQAADNITCPFVKYACQKHNLLVLGTGGKMMHQVEDISVSFIAKGNYSLTQARKHYLSIVTPFVEEIRNSVELKQYLLYPDNPEKAALISITYVLPNSEDPKPPSIAHVFMLSGEIVYSVSPEPWKPYKNIHEETYQQALEIVGKE